MNAIHEDWLNRWESGQIGFHLDRDHPQLLRFADQWVPRKRERVLVPLAGKSRDLMWLTRRGHSVVAVELSKLAIETFFREQGLVPKVSESGAHVRYQVSGLDFFCGDFFTLTPEQIGKVEAIWDRASMIALPPEMRSRYIRQLFDLARGAVPTLLVTLVYDQSRMTGPPFCVEAAEVKRAYGSTHSIVPLADADALEPRFREKGLVSLREQVWQLVPYSMSAPTT